LRDCLKGQFVLDGAVAEVRSFIWDIPETRIINNDDYVISRPIGRSASKQPIKRRLPDASGLRPWGPVAIVPPHSPITVEIDPGEMTFVACFFSPDYFERTLELDEWTSDLTETFISLKNPFLGAVLDHLAKEILAPRPTSQTLVESLVASVSAELGSLVRQTDQTRATTGALSRWQLKLVTELLDDVARRGQRIRLEDVAARCSISVRHLVRAFKRSTGTTIHSYLRDRRLERIKAMLAGNELSMAAIASITGYASPSQFSAEFRRLTGISPSSYRNQNRAAGNVAFDSPWTRPQR
jgi:AraC family transcriptional regulator